MKNNKIYQDVSVSQNDLETQEIIDSLLEDEILTDEQAQNVTVVVIQQKVDEDEEIVEEEIIEVGKYSEEELQEILAECKAQISSGVSDNDICDIQRHLYISSNGYVINGYSYSLTDKGINNEFGTQKETYNIMNKPLENWSILEVLTLLLLIIALLCLFHDWLFKK